VCRGRAHTVTYRDVESSCGWYVSRALFCRTRSDLFCQSFSLYLPLLRTLYKQLQVYNPSQSTFRPGLIRRTCDIPSSSTQIIHHCLTKSAYIHLVIFKSNTYIRRAGALFNAVKKQYGLHAYLLPLALPKPAPTPVAVPVAMPRLPPPPNSDLPTSPPPPDSLAMSEKDINQTAKFTREFVVQSLIPWMERCVVEWNEAVSSLVSLFSRSSLNFCSIHQQGDYRPGYSPRRVDCLDLQQHRHLLLILHHHLFLLFHLARKP